MDGTGLTPISPGYKRIAKITGLLDKVTTKIPRDEQIVDVFFQHVMFGFYFLVGAIIGIFLLPGILIVSLSPDNDPITTFGKNYLVIGIPILAVILALFTKALLERNVYHEILVLTDKALYRLYGTSGSKQRFRQESWTWSSLKHADLVPRLGTFFITLHRKRPYVNIRLPNNKGAVLVVQSLMAKGAMKGANNEETDKERTRRHIIDQNAMNKYHAKLLVVSAWMCILIAGCAALCIAAAVTKLPRVMVEESEWPYNEHALPFDDLDVTAMVCGSILGLIILGGSFLWANLLRVGAFFKNRMPLVEKEIVVELDGIRYPSVAGEVLIKFSPGWCLWQGNVCSDLWPEDSDALWQGNVSSDKLSPKWNIVDYAAAGSPWQRGFFGPVKDFHPFFVDVKNAYDKYLWRIEQLLDEERIANTCFKVDQFKVAFVAALLENTNKPNGKQKKGKVRAKRARIIKDDEQQFPGVERIDPDSIEPVPLATIDLRGRLKGMVKHYLEEGEGILLAYKHPNPLVAFKQRRVSVQVAVLVLMPVLITLIVLMDTLMFSFVLLAIPLMAWAIPEISKDFPFVHAVSNIYWLARAECVLTTSKLLMSVGQQVYVVKYKQLDCITEKKTNVKGWYDLEVRWAKGQARIKDIRFPLVQLHSRLAAVLTKVGLLQKKH